MFIRAKTKGKDFQAELKKQTNQNTTNYILFQETKQKNIKIYYRKVDKGWKRYTM